MIHKLTVRKEVYETLLILTRLLNNMDDKLLRQKYKKIFKFKKKLFPIEQDLNLVSRID